MAKSEIGVVVKVVASRSRVRGFDPHTGNVLMDSQMATSTGFYPGSGLESDSIGSELSSQSS